MRRVAYEGDTVADSDKDKPENNGAEAAVVVASVAIVAAGVFVFAMAYAGWLVVGVLVGLVGGAALRNRRFQPRTIVAVGVVGVIAGALLWGLAASSWVQEFKRDLYSKTAAELRDERRQARKDARARDTQYEDPADEFGVLSVTRLHYGPALSEHWPKLLVLAIPAGLITFASFYWIIDSRRRRQEEEIAAAAWERRRAEEAEQARQDDRQRQIIREEFERERKLRGEDEPPPRF